MGGVTICHSAAGSRFEWHDAPEEHHHLRAGSGHRRRPPPRAGHFAPVQILLPLARPARRVRLPGSR